MPTLKDDHERFVALLTQHQPVIRATIRAVVRRPEDVDEVMQEVTIAAWRKFDSLTDSDGFAKWACTIARYEVLTFQRGKARDRLQLDEDLVEKMVSEAEEELPQSNRQLTLLERCLDKLPEQRRKLMLQVYEPGCSTKELAPKLGKSVDGLYQLLRRIRLELKRCVQQLTAKEAKEGDVL